MSANAARSTKTLLQAALEGTASAPTPREAAHAILKVCIERLNATSGCIYLLDLRYAAYLPFAEEPKDPSFLVDARAEHLRIPPQRIGALADFLSQSGSAGSLARGVVVYAFRRHSCLGALRLDGPELADVPDAMRDDLRASANLLVSVYEDEFAFNLLNTIQAPLDFGQSDREFFRGVAALIQESSGMELVALRERDGDALRTLALEGFGNGDLREWDLSPVSEYPPFARALAGEAVAVEDMRAPELARLRAHHWSKPVRSFVVAPVRVGTEVFGVLSVGARCRFDYAPLEMRGYESIANGIGVSIANFRNSRALATSVHEYTEAAVAITAMEVARAARHEATGHIDTAGIALDAMWRKLGRPAAMSKDFNGLEQDLDHINSALNKIKFATKAPEAKWSTISVKELWRQAQAAVAGRIQEDRIDVRTSGPDVDVYARPDWLRQVFLNLLLNSIDAFRDANKRGRRIELEVARPATRARHMELTYRDNATGVSPQRLQVPEEFEEEPVHQQIFQPGVTSKKGGSGFGLWLVRRILDDHFGSIDLADYRNGVTFVIRLPKPDEAKTLLGDS